SKKKGPQSAGPLSTGRRPRAAITALSPCFSIQAPYQPFRPESWHVLLNFSSRDEMEVKMAKVGDWQGKVRAFCAAPEFWCSGETSYNDQHIGIHRNTHNGNPMASSVCPFVTAACGRVF